MTSKKIKYLIVISLIGLLIIVLYMFAPRILRETERLPLMEETLIKDSITADPVDINISLRDSIVSFGLDLLGTPYVVGACRRDGFDCSGFVYYVFQHFKVHVPRSSSQFKNIGSEIPVDSVRKGDILLFLSPTRNVIGHVGFVVNPKGKDSDFIHASSGSEMKVIISSLKQEGYKRRFVKAIDVL